MTPLRYLVLLVTVVGVWGKEPDVEVDLLLSFFVQSDKLHTTTRLQDHQDWLKKTRYKTAVGITVENWSNHKLEAPDVTIDDGGVDRWLKPMTVPRHTRDISIIAYSTRGSETKGSVSYLIEDSWPITWVNIGWHASRNGLDVLLGMGKTHLDYDDLLLHESIAQAMSDGMRFYKANDKFVLSVSCEDEGEGRQLTLSLIPRPQSGYMDFWSWEEHYKSRSKLAQTVTVQKIDIQPTPGKPKHAVMNTPPDIDGELENERGVFERKDLLIPGLSGALQGNRSIRELLAKESGSVGVALRLENWSKDTIGAPSYVKFQYGRQSSLFPLTSVRPGRIETSILDQSSGATGVSGLVRWPVGNGTYIISMMISVPYNQHLWDTWVAIGIFKNKPDQHFRIPDFDAMYSGTPDSAWFVREKVGRRMEFAKDEFLLVLDGEMGSSKPVLTLSLLPTIPGHEAPSIKAKLEGKSLPEEEEDGGRQQKSMVEGEQSVVSALSSSAQCYCPCMGASSHFCSSKLLILLIALLLQLPYFTQNN